MAAPNGGPSLDSERRRELADSFQDGGEHYERVRPGYPEESLTWLLSGTDPAGVLHATDPNAMDLRASDLRASDLRASDLRASDPKGTELSALGPNTPGLNALDIGAGTGKFTVRLAERGLTVVALDPSRDMLRQLEHRLPGVRTILGAAERIELPDSSMDLVTVAQAWHWIDPLSASAEIARVLRPGGVLGLVWNQLDVSVPWVHRLSRIMHAGDVHKPDFRPLLGPEFSTPQLQLNHWFQPLTPGDMMELVKSRSYYLRANEATRAKVLANLRWYLFEHLGHDVDDILPLPYLTQTWRAAALPRQGMGRHPSAAQGRAGRSGGFTSLLPLDRTGLRT
ncbi:methyltransferase domain-containing protein [Paenarthrobacter sp. PH39-S1]|uniref:class I SAM-dependent methyltransferase n=1 Tax=Paenarthrobacter sp. PH39-S1 TaxID=3046204 RepID=UPI0024B9AFB1|nr:methyltransferase domain-containing protein [Paenarthrobacter sp. PH39-S1]MDJ0358105.1 methyltransferase domain-containing protein [Paenarthrobacter sp. PH39-S1]